MSRKLEAPRRSAAAPLQPDRLFGLLSDTTRLRVLNLLAAGELCVCDLVDMLRVPQPTVSRHLQTLRSGSLVRVRRVGKYRHYSLTETEGQVLAAVLRRLEVHGVFRAERRRAERGIAARLEQPCETGS